jgi:hypothetical protein
VLDANFINNLVGDFHLPALSSYLKTVYIGFIATFLKLYEIEPVNAGGWSLPQTAFAAGIALPQKDIRVKIRSRDYNLQGKEINVKAEEENVEKGDAEKDNAEKDVKKGNK